MVSWVPRHNSGHRKLSIRLTSSHDRELFEMKQTTICYEYGNGHEHGTQSWTSTSRRFSSFYRALHFHAFSRRFCWFCYSERIFLKYFLGIIHKMQSGLRGSQQGQKKIPRGNRADERETRPDRSGTLKKCVKVRKVCHS